MERVWKRTPLVLAFSAELREPGDYRALDAAGVPVLIRAARTARARVREQVRAPRRPGHGARAAASAASAVPTTPGPTTRTARSSAITGAGFRRRRPPCHGLGAAGRGTRGTDLGGARPEAADRPRRFSVWLRALLASSASGLASVRAAAASRGRTGRSPTTATSTSTTCRSCTRTRSAEHAAGALRRLGAAPARQFPNPLLRSRTCPNASGHAGAARRRVDDFPARVDRDLRRRRRAACWSRSSSPAKRRRSRHGAVVPDGKGPDDAARAAHEQFELLGYVVREEDYATGLRQQRALATGASRVHVRPQRGRRPALPSSARSLACDRRRCARNAVRGDRQCADQ